MNFCKLLAEATGATRYDDTHVYYGDKASITIHRPDRKLSTRHVFKDAKGEAAIEKAIAWLKENKYIVGNYYGSIDSLFMMSYHTLVLPDELKEMWDELL